MNNQEMNNKKSRSDFVQAETRILIFHFSFPDFSLFIFNYSFS